MALILLWKSRGSERATLLGDWRAVRRDGMLRMGTRSLCFGTHSFFFRWFCASSERIFVFSQLPRCSFRWSRVNERMGSSACTSERGRGSTRACGRRA